MPPFLARFSEPVLSGHLASWADFIITTPELEFSVYTAGMPRDSADRAGREVARAWEGLPGARQMQEKRPPADGLVRRQRQDRAARKQGAGDQAGDRHGED
jgi:hypothetical protein